VSPHRQSPRPRRRVAAKATSPRRQPSPRQSPANCAAFDTQQTKCRCLRRRHSCRTLLRPSSNFSTSSTERRSPLSKHFVHVSSRVASRVAKAASPASSRPHGRVAKLRAAPPRRQGSVASSSPRACRSVAKAASTAVAKAVSPPAASLRQRQPSCVARRVQAALPDRLPDTGRKNSDAERPPAPKKNDKTESSAQPASTDADASS